MKLLIAVPSKGRAALFQKRTFRWLPDLGYDYQVFVEPQELEAYRLITSQVINVGANDRGLWYCKQSIQQYAQEHGYDVVFKMDDDINSWSTGYGLRNHDSTMEALGKTIPICMDKFERNSQVGAIGFNYAIFMHPNGSEKWSINQRLQTAYMVRTDSMYVKEDVSTFEDYYTCLMIWLNGGYTLRCNLAGIQVSGVGKEKGGLQMFDRAKLAEKELEIMRQIYSALRVKRVKNKTWTHEPDFTAIKRDIFGMTE